MSTTYSQHDPVSGMTFVRIPAGTFIMGSPKDEPGRFEDEHFPHPGTIAGEFWLAQCPVTQEQWQTVMGNNPSYFVHAGPHAPVDHVSWYDCLEFVRILNTRAGEIRYRMPTEAEWEYACRAGTDGPFYSPVEGYCEGNCNTDQPQPPLPALDDIAWWCGNAEGTTHPVAQKIPNSWGLYDMLGNVWEWCELHEEPPRPYILNTAPLLPPGALQAIRGGPWYGMPRCVRSADRHTMSPGFLSSGVGFRIVRL